MLVLAALEGDVAVLRQQRDDVSLIAWATKCTLPDVMQKVIAACQTERGELAIGKARVAAWAWRVAYDRYPDLYRILLGLQ